MVPKDGIADPGQIVGQGTSGLVVMRSRLDFCGPGAQTVERSPVATRQFGGTQYGSGAMSEQHAQVAVALLGYSSELTTVAGRGFLGRQAKPTGEVPSILEMGDTAAGSRHQRRCSEETDTRYRQQLGTGRALSGQCGEFAFEAGNAQLQETDFLDSVIADQTRLQLPQRIPLQPLNHQPRPTEILPAGVFADRDHAA